MNTEFQTMMDLRDIANKNASFKIAFCGGLNCNHSTSKQKVISLEFSEILNEEDEPLPLVRCYRQIRPGNSLIFLDDIKLRNAGFYAFYNEEVYMLSTRVRSLHLTLTRKRYEKVYMRVFYYNLPPTLRNF